MLGLLAVFGLVLLQEPVRTQEDLQAKQRLQESEQHYRLGVEALQTERFDEAEQELRRAIKLDPNSYLAYFSLGKTYIALKQYDDSVRAYLACRQAWDRSVADSTERGLDREARREDQLRVLQDRIRELETAQRSARSDVERQRLQERIGIIEVGMRSIERLRGSDHGVPDPPAEFALALGSAYLRAGSVDEAEKAYREALKLRPKYGEAHNNLAVICIKRGDYEDAYTHVKAAQKAGFKVHPQLVSDIEAARRAGGK
ncbi:MAG: tetratricopeptide repeat protein [Vicinamibacteria bacterium]|nr:tetratricopeptide repeat protein [Vicinamibacteria bacterium]MBP9948130.1 tetratricopeptide repeat protein [Vicinamibacteria bacterium]